MFKLVIAGRASSGPIRHRMLKALGGEAVHEPCRLDEEEHDEEWRPLQVRQLRGGRHRERRTRRAGPERRATPDCPQRLERLREASDLTWNAFANTSGIDKKHVHRWRSKHKPVKPDAGGFYALLGLRPHSRRL